MFTDVQVINLGLGKLGSARVANIAPPVSPLERFVATGWPLWRTSELAKRRWVFATQFDYVMTLSATLVDVDKPYEYNIPPDSLRLIRQRRTEWRQSGRKIRSNENPLSISYIRDTNPDEFDPLFVEVLACRIALECAEYVTQSNSKKADANGLYNDAVNKAGQANAYTIGPEDYGADDNDFPFITARYGY